VTHQKLLLAATLVPTFWHVLLLLLPALLQVVVVVALMAVLLLHFPQQLIRHAGLQATAKQSAHKHSRWPCPLTTAATGN
jgi:hypothetical protein